MLEVKVLGSVAPYPKGNKKCSGFLINYNDKKYVFDLGNGAVSNMDLINDLKQLKVFISHFHPDHYGDLSALAQALFVYNRLGYTDTDVDVYVPKTKGRTETISIPGNPYDHDDWGTSYSVEREPLELEYLKSIIDEKLLKINTFNHLNYKDSDVTIKSTQTLHQIPSYAFRFECNDGVIVYSGDSGYDESLASFAKDSDLFICESSFLRGQYRQDNYHMYAYEAAEIAKKANAKTLLLTHFWPEIDKESYLKEAKEVFYDTKVAEEGKVLVLKR